MGLAYNIFTAVFASIGAFLFGYDSGVIASVLTFPSFTNQFGFHGSDDPRSSAVVATFTGGCFFGAAAAGWSSDRLGRKRTIQIGCLWALLGCALQAGGSNIATLMVGRIIAGFAIGILSMVVPLYNTEIAPPKIRGFIVGLAQQMIGIGFIAANWVGYGCQFFGPTDNRQWRIPLGLQLVPAFVLLVGIQFLPFSPRWLIEQGRDDEARAVVYKLHGANSHSELAPAAEEEFLDMQSTIRAEFLTRSRSLSDLYSTAPNRRRLVVACGVQIFGQFTGINVINYFGPQMYQALGLENNKLLLVQGIYGAVGPITNLIFIIFILDRIGRKQPLLFGAASLTALFAVLAAIVASFPPSAEGSTNLAAQKAGIAVIFMMSIVFSLSFGPVSWVLASEIFPTRSRGMGVSVATCCNWLLNVLISEVSPIGMGHVGWRYYILFIALNAFDFIFILLFFPETKGKTLEEMAVLFGDSVDAVDILGAHKGHMQSQSQD
ncbi:general substrate transporter [Sistotremastrum suecicum HHB10207 ss-3]|uniref:General substrate transporter n=1 Tax=Sistotremastrum suecicum HHB10207 ss-3 TaxID=1314776 RepID=A0A166ANF3_9AGAM|nr:general substrate transporter [Sistotremastrum suecicum HHB10207 ss-3]